MCFWNEQKLKPTKSIIHARDEQVVVILEEHEKDIENFKIVIQNRDKQLVNSGKILKAAKGEYEKVTKKKTNTKKNLY